MEILTKEFTNHLLSMFVGNDELRESLNQYFTIDWLNKKWCCSTDAHSLIIIPENEDNKLPEPKLRPPDAVRVIPEFSIDEKIDIADLKKQYDDIEMVKNELTDLCEACEGVGRFEHFDIWYDCETCDETGESGTGVFEDVKNPDKHIVIGEALFAHFQIKRIIDVIDLTESDELTLLSKGKHSTHLFKLNIGIYIISVPINKF